MWNNIPFEEQEAAGFDKHIASLTTSQREFIVLLNDWFGNRRNKLIVVTGPPGAGKTYAVVKTLAYMKDVIVIRMAPTARLAKKIDGKTIHSSMRLSWTRGSVLAEIEKDLKDKVEHDDYMDICMKQSIKLRSELDCQFKADVIVIDEIGMLAFWLAYRVIEHFFKKEVPKLVVVMGDRLQLRPISSPFNIFQVQFKEFDTSLIEMIESKRFTPEYQIIVEGLRNVMHTKDEAQVLEYVKNHYPVVEIINYAILDQCDKVLAYKRTTVGYYNEYYLKRMPEKRIHLYKVCNNKVFRQDYFAVKPGCLVMVTANCEDVLNGTLLEFERYNAIQDIAVCRDMSFCVPVTVNVPRSMYTGKFPLVLAFACTVHKFQGETIDDKGIAYNFDKCRDLHLIYTALSRVRSMDQIVAVKM